MDYLSPHLSVREFTATRHVEFMDEQAHPPPEALVAGKRLATDVWERFWSILGRLIVTSGYRCPGLNEAVGGAPSSAHMFGRAVDFLPAAYPLPDTMIMLSRSTVPFDKLILEAPGGRAGWIHTQCPRDSLPPRRQVLMTFGEGVYLPYDEHDPRVLGLAA